MRHYCVSTGARWTPISMHRSQSCGTPRQRRKVGRIPARREPNLPSDCFFVNFVVP